MDFESLMLKKLGENKERESPMSTSLNPEPNLNPAISINQGQKKQAPAKAPKRRPLATMKPRVRCAKSPCDFAGKQGPEMNKHMKLEHQTEFKCNECGFKTKYKVLRRSHMMKNHYKKCETCDFTAKSETILKTHKQEEHGILSNSMGFMMTNNMDEEADLGTNENVITNHASLAKIRKTKSEYLKDVREAKSTNKSKKDMTRSFKDKYLTLKKNICNLQKVHGVEAEFALIVKNNLQIAGGRNASTTAGRFMVVCDGRMKELLFSSGIKFEEGFVLMDNDHDMQIKESQK